MVFYFTIKPVRNSLNCFLEYVIILLFYPVGLIILDCGLPLHTQSTSEVIRIKQVLISAGAVSKQSSTHLYSSRTYGAVFHSAMRSHLLFYGGSAGMPSSFLSPNYFCLPPAFDDQMKRRLAAVVTDALAHCLQNSGDNTSSDPACEQHLYCDPVSMC